MAITPKKALNPVFASRLLTAFWGLLAGSRTGGGKSRLKVARIRYGLKIKRYATVFYFTELTPDMQVEFDRIKRIIEESYCSFGFTPIDTPVLERS